MAKTKKPNYVSKNMEIRGMLQDIVGEAYSGANPEELEKYKKFFIECSQKDVKSFAGKYTFHNRSILIVGLQRPSKHIVVTTIHELTHHVDYCMRGTSDHGPEFYEIYKRLLFAALNMEIISIEDIHQVTDVTDAQKIKGFLRDYVPRRTGYKKNLRIIKVFDCYAYKEQLKRRGYKWDGLSEWWQCETLDPESEILFLSSYHLRYEVSDANDINIIAKCYIIATDGSYENRDLLKTCGFSFDSKKKYWRKKIVKQESKTEMAKLQQLGLTNKVKFKISV